DAGASVQAGGFALAGGRMGGEPVEQVLAGPGGLPVPCGLGAAVVVGAAGAALGLVAPGHQATVAVAGLAGRFLSHAMTAASGQARERSMTTSRGRGGGGRWCCASSPWSPERGRAPRAAGQRGRSVG